MSFVHIPIRSNVNWPWEMMNEAESVATKMKWLPAKEKKRAQQYRNQFLFIVLPASFQFVSRQLFFGFPLLLFVCVLIFNRNVNALDCVCRRFMSNNELIELVHIYTHRRVCSNDLFYIFILFHFCHTHTMLPKNIPSPNLARFIIQSLDVCKAYSLLLVHFGPIIFSGVCCYILGRQKHQRYDIWFKAFALLYLSISVLI